MADHVNLARLSHVAPPHAWRGKTKLKQAGFVFKEDKLLCAAPNAAGTFWAPGAADEAFHARLPCNGCLIMCSVHPDTFHVMELL